MATKRKEPILEVIETYLMVRQECTACKAQYLANPNICKDCPIYKIKRYLEELLEEYEVL